MNTMPEIGFGLWKVAPEDCEAVILEAIRAGYRHFDCAADYGNEHAVGAALAKAIEQGQVTREELWITSKLWNTFHDPEHVEAACRKTLQDLGLTYLDLYLVHFPIALEHVPVETRYPPEWIHDPQDAQPRMKPARVPLHLTWGAMEKLVDAGLTRKIGVCNYTTALLHDLMSYARTPPAVLQVEMHPHLSQEKLLRLARQYGLQVTAFSPLGALSYVELDMATAEESVLEAQPVLSAAKAHRRSPAQVVLRWGLQRGVSVIPKSTSPTHMRENLDVTDFQLSEQEMEAISSLDRGRRYNDPGVFCEAAFGAFHPIYD